MKRPSIDQLGHFLRGAEVPKSELGHTEVFEKETTKEPAPDKPRCSVYGGADCIAEHYEDRKKATELCWRTEQFSCPVKEEDGKFPERATQETPSDDRSEG